MIALDFGGPVEVPFEPWNCAELDDGVAARFCRIAKTHAASTAIADGETSWTYAELSSAVESVRRALAADGGGEPVAIESDHSRFTAAAMLGALAAGRPYVPLDPAFPEERNRYIREHSGTRLLLTRAWLEDCCSLGALPEEPACAAGDKVAYILYTSGSMGRPKGVYQNQRNLLQDVMQYVHSIHLSAADRHTMLYSASVSGANRDLYGALLTGASLHLHRVKEAGFAGLRERMLAERITVYHSVPPVFRAFLSGSDFFDSVRIVYLAGDRLDHGDVALFRRHFARGAWLYTGIGCTEAATLYRQWFIGHDTPLDQATSVPVGRAIPDRETRLVDGEIEVSSPYLALGYWRELELTSHRFVPVTDRPGWRSFRPGDRGCERPDGLLEFLGRGDQQVKIRGHRVEMGEVERALLEHPEVREAAVLYSEGSLVAFYTAARAIAWREFLADRLPTHMIPSRFERVDALPRLGNFKLDRVALSAAAPPWSSLEQLIAEAFGEMLERDGIGTDDDFHTLGGDSLLALRLPLLLEERLGRALPANLLAHASTPRTIARWLERDTADNRPPLLCLPSIEGGHGWAQVLAPALRGKRVIGLSYRSGENASVSELAEELRADVERRGIAAPFRLIGYSFGARVAFELARQWEAKGKTIDFLCLIDTPPQGPLELQRVGRWHRAFHFGRRLLRCPVELWPRVLDHTRKRQPNPVQPGRRAAFLAYQPQPYDGEVVLIRTTGENLGWQRLPADLGWSAWCRGGVRVRYFEGTHDIANPWCAASLNQAVSGELRRALGVVENR